MQSTSDTLNNEKKLYAKECINKVVDMGISFKLQDKFRKKHINEDVIKRLYEMPLEAADFESIISKVNTEILPYCANFGSEKFMGFPDAGNSISGMTGAVLSEFLQQNLINSSFCAPIATYIEIAVISWLREIVRI